MASTNVLRSFRGIPAAAGVAIVIFATATIATAPARGQVFEEAKLLASDGAEGDHFGWSVSLWGDVALIGAMEDDDNGEDSGSAWVYRYDGVSWSEKARLLAPDGAAGDCFGYSVSVSGDIAVVGAYFDDDNGTNSGSAYVYRFDGASWVMEAKLVASDGQEFAHFGCSVSIWGETIVIGAYQDDGCDEDSGSAYVLRHNRSAWIEEAKLVASDGQENDHFGCSVSIWEDSILVGARDEGGNGSAYLFHYQQEEWLEGSKLEASDGGTDHDEFGTCVEIRGNTTVIGAPRDEDIDNDSGAAYVFRFDGETWAEEAKLLASDGAKSDYFGTAVAVFDDVIAVGASLDDDNGPASGSAYLFRYNGASWLEEAKLLASDGAEIACFGHSVSLWSDDTLIGAPQDHENGSQSGAAYTFAMPCVFIGEPGGSWFDPSNWNRGYVPDPDCDVLIHADGHVVIDSPSAAAESVRIEAGGSLTFASNSDLAVSEGVTVNQGAALYGEGTVTGDLFNHGLISPGTSLGTLRIIGAYTQYETAELRIELSENLQHDLFDVAGHDATLDGTLTVECIDPYEGWPEDSFDVVLYDNVIGEFATVALPEVDGCLTVGLDMPANSVRVEFQAAPVEPEELAKLLASDGAAGDAFGCGVSISGTVAVVGAVLNDDNGENSGSAYIFRFDGSDWVQEAKLLASDAGAGDYFGNSVSVSDEVVIIGASQDDDNGSNAGAAYVFRFDGASWIEETKLLAMDGAQDDCFGCSVAMCGNIAVVGAYRDIHDDTASGSAYVFRFNGAIWYQEAKLLPPDGSDYDRFGGSVATDYEMALIGAYHDDDNGPDSGSAYVFRRSTKGWAVEDKLVPLDGWDGDYFGNAVSICGDLALIGALYDGDNGYDAGSAYVFRHDRRGWTEEAKLLPSTGAAKDYFGFSVSISGTTALIGAPEDEMDKPGSAYVFSSDGRAWIEQARLRAADEHKQDFFGREVALSDDLALVAAPRDDDLGGDSGSAYVFDLVHDDCNENGIADNCDIMFGFSNDINANGIPDECECLADLNGDGKVNIDDLFQILNTWGTCDGCPEDLNGDGKVNIDDLFIILNEWGPCE